MLFYIYNNSSFKCFIILYIRFVINVTRTTIYIHIMDKSWMSKDRLSKEYVDGVDQFLAFALAHTTDSELMRCPCQSCANLKCKTPREIKYHLLAKA